MKPATPGSKAWSNPVRLSEVGRSPINQRLKASESERVWLARQLGLDQLISLEALVTLTPWHDGARVEGRWSAEVEQTCGVTLEPFRTRLAGDFSVRALPAGSRHAPEESAVVAVDPEAEDPPDILEGDQIDPGAYVVEHLSLEIDPFPRKPGVVFDAPPPEEPPSPFAVLHQLKPKPDAG